jgi:hypothetical protein
MRQDLLGLVQVPQPVISPWRLVGKQEHSENLLKAYQHTTAEGYQKNCFKTEDYFVSVKD